MEIYDLQSAPAKASLNKQIKPFKPMD